MPSSQTQVSVALLPSHISLLHQTPQANQVYRRSPSLAFLAKCRKPVGSQLAAMMGNCDFLTTSLSSCLYNGGNFGPRVSAIFPSLLIHPSPGGDQGTKSIIRLTYGGLVPVYAPRYVNMMFVMRNPRNTQNPIKH